MLYGDGNNRSSSVSRHKESVPGAHVLAPLVIWHRERDWAHVALNYVTDAVLTTDENGRVTYLNREAEVLTGWSKSEVSGSPVEQVLALIDRQTCESMVSPAIRAMIENRPLQLALDAILIHQNGSQREIEYFAAPIHDRQGDVGGSVMIFHDACQSFARSAQLAYQAQYDPLTALPNRFLFADRVSRALIQAKRGHHKMALLYVDMDRFKVINDTLGHAAGDRYLQIVAERLSGCIRMSDTICRHGGDEFIMLLNEIESVESALMVAQKALAALDQPCLLVGHRHTISASIGVSIYPDHSTDQHGLLHCADLAMYCAKQKGRHQCQLFSSEMGAQC
ncbi:diguanylate cyclase domain-containing protein [Halomonas sp. HMF6819]|uniref:diguanylate cyclase domain-containing protein n=1 Tax=Halomonas sp. HMF6819 TaxID=3373085 RepID=UPI0037A9949E